MACDVELEGKPSVVFFKEKDMSNKMTLVVRFHMDEAVKKEFTAKFASRLHAHREGGDVRRGFVGPGYA